MQVRQFDRIVACNDNRDAGRVALGGGIHPYYEIFVLKEGEALLEWIGMNYHATAPALFIVAPNTPHRLYRLGCTFDSWFAEIETGSEEQGLPLESIAAWNRGQPMGQANHPLLSLVFSTLQSMADCLSQPAHVRSNPWLRDVVSYDLHKLFLLVQACLSEASAADTNNLVSAAADDPIYELIRHMESHYDRDIHLSELAELSAFTPSYIIRLFKNRIGLTPIQYVHRLRLNAASSYLRSTSLPIQDIAVRSGYSSLHYFSRAFKQAFGSSPTEWRQKESRIG